MQRWTTSYRFVWTPIVTFARRQLRLLDWIEENLDPVAFYDRDGATGVAVLSRDIRIMVDRNSMTLEDGAVVDAGVSVLAHAVGGVLETFQPKELRLRSASVAWSGSLDGFPYNEARAGLARGVAGLSLGEEQPEGVPVPVDVSALMDVLTPDYRGQVEWGVVSAEELVERLSDPPLGRIATNRPTAAKSAVDVDELPESSVFVDTTFWPLNPAELTTVDEVNAAVASVDAVSKLQAEALYSRTSRFLGESK